MFQIHGLVLIAACERLKVNRVKSMSRRDLNNGGSARSPMYNHPTLA